MQRKNDIKVFLSLILWMLIPSIYLLIRMNMVSVNHVDINILGQMVLHSYCHLGCIFCLQ